MEERTFRGVPGSIAGIAAPVVDTGAPVVEAVRKVMAAFGLPSSVRGDSSASAVFPVVTGSSCDDPQWPIITGPGGSG